jgi:hypothetical protein
LQGKATGTNISPSFFLSTVVVYMSPTIVLVPVKKFCQNVDSSNYFSYRFAKLAQLQTASINKAKFIKVWYIA